MSATAILSGSLLFPRPWAFMRKKEGHDAPKLRESTCFKIGWNQVRLLERENNGRKAKKRLIHVTSTVAPLCSGNEDTVLSMDAFKHGMFVEDQFVYRQTFVIRSYQIGPDMTVTMESLMNLLQETALNHVSGSCLYSDESGSTHHMILRKLFWVVTRIHLQVEKYSRWGDVVEIDTWVAASGKNGMRRDWIIRECNTKRIIAKATSNWVMMNRVTRRLSKLPVEVRGEIKPFYLERRAISDRSYEVEKIDKLTEETAEHIRSHIAPRWSDMDANQHVNNVKYIGLILESVPMHVLEDYHLTSMELHFRRECRQSNLLESLTSISTQEVQQTSASKTSREVELWSIHLLRLHTDKEEIARARAEWQHK